MSDSLQLYGLYSSWSSPGQNTGVGSCSLLQGIFPSSQGSNPGLPHCRWVLYQLSHQGSPRILEWVAYPFSSRSSWPRNWTGVSCLVGRFFTGWASREAPVEYCSAIKKQKQKKNGQRTWMYFSRKFMQVAKRPPILTDTCSNLDESRGNCAAWKKPVSKVCTLYAFFLI